MRWYFKHPVLENTHTGEEDSDEVDQIKENMAQAVKSGLTMADPDITKVEEISHFWGPPSSLDLETSVEEGMEALCAYLGLFQTSP